jgi:hypothetical protein
MVTASSPGSSEMSTSHVYNLCFFDRDQPQPSVELIEAFDDAEAIGIALGKRPSLSREVWDRHRLVARLGIGDYAGG